MNLSRHLGRIIWAVVLFTCVVSGEGYVNLAISPTMLTVHAESVDSVIVTLHQNAGFNADVKLVASEGHLAKNYFRQPVAEKSTALRFQGELFESGTHIVEVRAINGGKLLGSAICTLVVVPLIGVTPAPTVEASGYADTANFEVFLTTEGKEMFGDDKRVYLTLNGFRSLVDTLHWPFDDTVATSIRAENEINSAGVKFVGESSGIVMEKMLRLTLEYDLERWNRQDDDSLPLHRVSDMAVDHRGTEWFAEKDRGLIAKGPNGRKSILENKDAKSGYVKEVEVDSHGNLWVLTRDDLRRFDGTFWFTYDTSNSPLPNFWSATITADWSGNLWIGCSNNVFRLSRKGWARREFGAERTDRVRQLLVDKSGSVWCLLLRKGLYKYSNGRVSRYRDINDRYTTEHVRRLALDSENNLWVAYHYWRPIDKHVGVVAKHNGSTWEVFDSRNSGMPFSRVLSISTDNSGHLWIVGDNPGPADTYHTPGRVCRYDGAEWHKEAYDSLSDVGHIFVDGETKYFFPTWERCEYGVYSPLTKVSVGTSVREPVGRGTTSTLNAVRTPGGIFLETDIDISSANVRVYDLSGRLLTSEAVSGQASRRFRLRGIDGELANGVYALVVRTNESVFRKTFVLP